MMRCLRHLHVVGLLSVFLFAPTSALAQSDVDKATAREIGQAAEVKLTAKDYKGAESDFRRANALFHAPTLVLGLARAQAAQGKVVEAWESYHSIILENPTATPIFAKALASAQQEIGAVEARRGRLTITVTGADSPNVTVDDVPVRAEALGIPRFIDPGAHVVKASAAGGKAASANVTIAEGGHQDLALDLNQGAALPAAVPLVAPVPAAPSPEPVAPAPPPPASEPAPATPASSGSWRKTAGYVGWGIGGAGIIEGIITGVLAVSKHGDLATACKNGVCPGTEGSTVSSYETLGALSTVGFIVGGVFAAGGTVLVLTAPKSAASPSSTGLHVVPYLGPGSAGAVGTF
jgi:hypothetical protein